MNVNEYLNKCLELSERASKDWHVANEGLPSSIDVLEGPNRGFGCECAMNEPDIEFIVHSRTALPKVCEALKVAMDHLDRIESLSRVETLDHEVRIAKDALDKIDKLFDDADGG